MLDGTNLLDNAVLPREVVARDRRVCVRTALPGDAAGVVRVRELTAAELVYTIVRPEEVDRDEGRQRKTIEQSLREPGWLFLVAECDGEVVGYLEFSNGYKARTRHAGMFSVYLVDGWRGHGIGRALVDALLEWATANPLVEKVTLAVFSTNERARALYERCGFAVEGVCPRDMKLDDGSYVDSILMYRFV
jgi:RimJ/RimL family protein N-acetyltransferase